MKNEQGIRICPKCEKAPSLPYHCYCKTCHNERQKAYYKIHPQSTNKSARRRVSVLREISREGRNKPCADCGKKYPFYVMDYDHVRGIKGFNIATISVRKVSKEILFEEIAKCDVVCSNCHRERTWSRGQGHCKV